MAIYQMGNYPMPTTAAAVPVTTGTAIKTLLQAVTPASMDMWLLGWGISFDGTSGTPIKCELCTTGSVAATVTAHTSTGLYLINLPSAPGSALTLSTTGTGYTASAEGTITAVKEIDTQLVSPSGGYSCDFPDDRQPYIPVSTVLRIRVTAAAAVNAYCWLKWRE